MKCQVIGRTNVWHLGEQKFGGYLLQPTRKLRSRNKYLEDILENQLNLQNFVFCKMFGNQENKCPAFGRTNVRCLGEQKFGGNLPQPTRKLRSRKKYFQDILEDQLNLQKFYFFRLRFPFKSEDTCDKCCKVDNYIYLVNPEAGQLNP